MNFKSILFTFLMAAFGISASAQCGALGYFSQSGSTVTFYDSSYSVNGHTVEWYFGDGTYGSGATTSHTYAVGTYTAYLSIYDSVASCFDSTSFSITIGTASGSCNAAFTYGVDSSNGLTLNFYNTSSNTSSYNWWFGGSATSTVANPSYTFTQSGYQTVCLTTYDSSGNFCDSICSTVYVPGNSSSSSCDAFFWTSVSGSTVGFYDSLTSSSIFEYSFGDGTYDYGVSPIHDYASSGTYNACLFVYDVTATGDTLLCDSFCRSVTIGSSSSCSASFAAYPDSINMSASSYPVYFSNTSTGVNYIWNFGDGNTDTSANPTHTYTSAGTYTVCLSVLSGYDSLGLPVVCDTICNTVTVGGSVVNCSPTMTSTVDSTNASTYYFSGSTPPTGGYAVWSVYDNATYTYSGQYATHTFASTGSVGVYYNVYRADSSWCGGTGDTLTLSAPACQASYYLAIDTTNLYNLYIVNNSTGTGSSTDYSWSFGDGNTSNTQNPTHQYATFGLYNLCLTISDSASGCYSTYCDSIGMDSSGNLLKRDGFGISVVNEADLLSVDQVDLIKGVSVYPNPSAGIVNIRLEMLSSETIEVNVLNSVGQKIDLVGYRTKTGSNTFSIDLSDEPNGLYFLNIKSGNEVKNARLYINR